MILLAVLHLTSVLGANTSLTIQSYEGTIPSLPEIGRALSKLRLDVQIPRIPVPGDGPDDGKGPGFIQDATVLSTFMDAVSVHDGHD